MRNHPGCRRFLPSFRPSRPSAAASGGLLAGLTLLLWGSLAYADVILDSPWDDGSIGAQFNESVSFREERPEVVQTPEACSGEHALRFPLTFRWDSSGFRNELTYRGIPHFSLNESYWFGFSIFLPDDWQADPTGDDILLQFHGWPDEDIGEAWRNPPIALLTRGDQWHLWALFDSKRNSGAPPRLEGAAHYDLGAFETGKWTNWVMHVHFSYESDGLIEVWKDSELVLQHTGGNSFNDALGPYLKFGNYKSAWGNVDTWGGPSAFGSRSHMFDALKIGDSGASFTEVNPACGDAAPPASPLLR